MVGVRVTAGARSRIDGNDAQHDLTRTCWALTPLVDAKVFIVLVAIEGFQSGECAS